jgi:hypothetical protein
MPEKLLKRCYPLAGVRRYWYFPGLLPDTIMARKRLEPLTGSP